jgi:large subunit ribosomal protein L25
MDMVALQASARAKDASAKALRRSKRVPGVVYGNLENTLVDCDEMALKKAYVKAGESTLVELEIEGKKIPVLFHALDFHPVSDRMIHVDFYAVDMKKDVEAEVHIKLEGEAPAVKDLGAILVTPLDAVTVRALPSDLPHHLSVDLGKLAEFGATLTVADIVVPKGVTIVTDAETVLVIAQEPRQEEVVETPAAAEGATAEGAPAAEGAAAAPEAGAEKKEG